jgi:hypothetical protein
MTSYGPSTYATKQHTSSILRLAKCPMSEDPILCTKVPKDVSAFVGFWAVSPRQGEMLVYIQFDLIFNMEMNPRCRLRMLDRKAAMISSESIVTSGPVACYSMYMLWVFESNETPPFCHSHCFYLDSSEQEKYRGFN